MYILMALLSMMPQALGPDYAALLPVIADYAAEEMFVADGPPIPVAVHLGGYVALVQRETGVRLDVSTLAHEFAGRNRNVSDRETATDCNQGSDCRYVATEPLFIDVEDLSLVPEGIQVVVRVQADGPPGAWKENRFIYNFAWEDGEWVRTSWHVLTRS